MVTLAFARWNPATQASWAAPCADEPAPSSMPDSELSASPCSFTAHPPKRTAVATTATIASPRFRARMPAMLANGPTAPARCGASGGLEARPEPVVDERRPSVGAAVIGVLRPVGDEPRERREEAVDVVGRRARTETRAKAVRPRRDPSEEGMGAESAGAHRDAVLGAERCGEEADRAALEFDRGDAEPVVGVVEAAEDPHALLPSEPIVQPCRERRLVLAPRHIAEALELAERAGQGGDAEHVRRARLVPIGPLLPFDTIEANGCHGAAACEVRRRFIEPVGASDECARPERRVRLV